MQTVEQLKAHLISTAKERLRTDKEIRQALKVNGTSDEVVRYLGSKKATVVRDAYCDYVEAHEGKPEVEVAYDLAEQGGAEMEKTLASEAIHELIEEGAFTEVST